MTKFFRSQLSFDGRIVTVTVVSTLLIILDRYHQFTQSKLLDRTILYLLVPLFVIVVVFRENPRDYGFQLGDWRAGLIITMLALGCVLPILWFLMGNSQTMRNYYQLFPTGYVPLYTFFDLFGWEFLFRGWLTFSYVKRFGSEGIWLQAVPFAIAHISKPEVETLSTIFGGFAFGWIAWRTHSFLYPFLIHWAIFTFVVLRAGG